MFQMGGITSRRTAPLSAPLKVDVAAETPADPTLSGHHSPGDDGGSEPTGRPISTSERLLLRLLQISALVGGGRWSDLLYAILAHSVYTIAGGWLVHSGFSRSVRMFGNMGNRTTVEVITGTSFMGLMHLLMWAPLAFCFVTSRRRCGQLFSTIGILLSHVAELTTYQGLAKKHRRVFNWLMLYIVGLITLPVYNSALPWYHVGAIVCGSISKHCVLFAFLSIMVTLFFIAAHFVPLKFIVAGLELLTGYRTIAAELRAVVEGRQQPNVASLRKLRALHDELSEAFASLTDAMSLELVTSMASGTLSITSVFLSVIHSFQTGTFSATPLIITYLFTAFMTLALPCELVQQVLNTASRTRCLLLKSQWQSELQQELGLFRESVARDLDTMGDLGLFRLRRSTILSILATIMTYIIIMVQFHMTEETAGEA